MTIHEYAAAQQQVGRPIHQHQGIWWEQTHFGYCRTAYQFQRFLPGSAAPRLTKAPLGYSHQVPPGAPANRMVGWMLLEGGMWEGYGLDKLCQHRRINIRKGLKQCEVRPILELEPVLEEVRQINITQALRHMVVGAKGKATGYYAEHADHWRKQMRCLFAAGRDDWWGAYANGRLVGYLVAQQVESDLWIETVKTHTEAMKLRPSDALHWTVMERARRSDSVARVIHGGRDRESLLKYKEEYLFQLVDIPYFAARECFVKLGIRCQGIYFRLRARRLKSAVAGHNPPGRLAGELRPPAPAGD